jgi:hypothetical protein
MNRGFLASLAAIVALAACASADEISIFGSPTRGMAGAGIALMRNPSTQMYLNPAAVSYVRGVQFGINNLNIDTEGATIRQISDTVKVGQEGVVNLADAARIIRTFGEKDKVQAVANADFGLVFNGVAITVGAVGDFRLYPNTQLRRWARGESNDLTGAQGDIYGLVAFSLPDITFAARLSAGSEQSEIAIGARVRVLRVFYTHYYADQTDLSSGNAGKRADELGEADYLDKRGTGVDVGIIWKPNKELPLTYAVVVENLIEPNIEFHYTAPNSPQGAGASQTTIKPLKRALHAGVALADPLGITYVADWVDITNNLGKRELRIGAEKRLAGGLAIRAGYGSKSGWAIGGEVFGINIAVAQKFPMQVSRSFAF